MNESYVTIATDDVSCLGCLVLCTSLKQTGTDRQISVLVNPTVSCHLKSVLRKSFDKVYCTNELYVISDGRNKFDVRGEYERLKCWLLTDFIKCVFLESDVLVVENIDDLFDRMELSAVSDTMWPDCFDAGVFVLQPSLKTYKQLIDYSITNPTADNSFQCLLNMFFCDWNIINMERKIPFIYNCQMNSSFYTHTSALVHFGHSIKAARLGISIMNPNSSINGVHHENWTILWKRWWKIFNEMVKPAVNSDETLHFKRTGCYYDSESAYNKQDSPCSNIAASHCSERSISQEEPRQTLCDKFVLSPIEIDTGDGLDSVGRIDKNAIGEDYENKHRLRWERGQIDYMGEDSFSNILAQLNGTLVAPSNLDQLVHEEG